ncbi:MAG: hypothetical protein M0038_14785 [Pseudomonadota bacterium]|jgi:hypothetical protein|nr:hypothetical protein [Pseudomonadota bacterium]
MGAVRALQDIQVRRLRSEESGRYQALMRVHHFLGALSKIGETLWYVATGARSG